MNEEKTPRKDGRAGLTIAEIERLHGEEFEALPEAEKRRYFDHMDRENFPTPAEFYGYGEELGYDGLDPIDDEEWTDDDESCDGRAMPEPTPGNRPDDRERAPRPEQ